MSEKSYGEVLWDVVVEHQSRSRKWSNAAPAICREYEKYAQALIAEYERRNPRVAPKLLSIEELSLVIGKAYARTYSNKDVAKAVLNMLGQPPVQSAPKLPSAPEIAKVILHTPTQYLHTSEGIAAAQATAVLDLLHSQGNVVCMCTPGFVCNQCKERVRSRAVKPINDCVPEAEKEKWTKPDRFGMRCKVEADHQPHWGEPEDEPEPETEAQYQERLLKQLRNFR
jgi:hypothetical protein